MSASGDKADIPDALGQCPLMTQSGHYGTAVRNRNAAKITRCTMP